MSISKIFLSLLVLLYRGAHTLSVDLDKNYCYSTDQNRQQVKHFSSKTAYEFVKGATFNKDAVIPNCQPTKFWMLSRHGTKLPDRGQISSLPRLQNLRDEIIKNYEAIVEGGLCADDLQLILDWKLDMNITTDKSQYLTVQGWNDLKILGQEYKKAFPDLFAEYNEKDFLFRYTDTQRTKASFKAFVEALFGEKAYEYVNKVRPSKFDILLAPYNYCHLWLHRVNRKGDHDTERHKFKHSHAMKKTIKRVSNRLGFKIPLTYKQVQQFWDICRFETAWFQEKRSAWCTPFILDDILVFEYLDDLTKEYAAGYASNLNPTIPCDIVQDMLTRLNSDEGPRVVSYFSHSGLIQLFATALGMQKDDALLTSAGFETAGNRKWRTSEIDSFAANYVVVKYNCSNDLLDPAPRIGFFSNQHPIDMVGCRNGFCKLSDFMRNYEKYLKANCMTVFCTENEF